MNGIVNHRLSTKTTRIRVQNAILLLFLLLLLIGPSNRPIEHELTVD